MKKLSLVRRIRQKTGPVFSGILIALLVWSVAGCNPPFSLTELLDGPTGQVLKISPESAQIGPGQTLTVLAEGGAPPYTYMVFDGLGIIDETTGEYIAPLTAGTEIVRVVDSYGAVSDAIIEVDDSLASAALAISPSSISLMASTSVTFTATGGTAPYTFAVTSGTGTINASSGVYSAPPGASSETVRVIDSAGATATASITVTSPGALTAISPSAITVSIGGGVTFAPIGGTGPYTYTIETNNSGAPPMVGASYTAGNTSGVTDTVRVTDAALDWREALVTVIPISTNVNYEVSSVSHNTGTVGGGAFDGDFLLRNSGTAAGSQNIQWEVYVSTNTTIGAGDQLIQSGTVAGGLAADDAAPGGPDETTVPFAGTWPSAGGTYYLIATVAATDEITGGDNTDFTSVLVSAPPAPDIDYVVSLMPAGGTTEFTGSGIAESFTIWNQGADPGSDDIFWTAYVSLGDNILNAGDQVIDSGSHAGGLAADDTGAGGPDEVSIPFTGTWPAAPGTYYFIVSVSASDEIVTGDYSASPGAFTLLNPLDIGPSVVSVNVGGSVSFSGTGGLPPYSYSVITNNSGAPPMVGANYTAGPSAGTDTVEITDSDAPPNTTTATVTVSTIVTNVDYEITAVNNIGGTIGGSGITGDFTVHNAGTANGGQTINWEVWVSTDTIIGTGDILIDSNTNAPLSLDDTVPGGPDEAVIGFTGTWPDTGNTYYLIAKVAASDDVTTANNTGNTSVLVSSAPDPDYIVSNIAPLPAVTGGTPIGGSFTAWNQGSGDGSDTIYWTAYLSTDTALDILVDVPVDSGTILGGLLADDTGAGGPDESTEIVDNGTWPEVGAPTSYYLFIDLSAGDESAVGNNNAYITVTVNPPDIDYVVTTVSNGGTPANGGTAIGETFVVQNAGADNGNQTVAWEAYVSPDATFSVGDILVDSGTTAALNGGASSAAIPIGGSWPTFAGTYYLIVDVASIDETATGNNWTASGAFSINDPDIDYIVQSVSNTGNPAGTGTAIAETFTYRNQGTYGGFTPVYWTAYISGDATLDAGDSPIDSGSEAPLGAGATSAAINIDDGTWPTTGGTYYIIVDVSTLVEILPTNNWAASAAFTIAAPDIDYIVTAVTNTGTPATGGTAITENFGVQNQGTDNATQTVFWEAYVSTNTTLSAGDILVDSGSTIALNGGASSGPHPISGTWPATADTYYLIVDVSATDETATGNNNTASGAFVISQPDIDYIVPAVTNLGSPAIYGSAIAETFTIENTGAYAGSTTVYWTAYVSNNATLDGADVPVDSGTIAPLGGGATSAVLDIDNGTWPMSGATYYLIVEVSSADENVTSNNETVSGAFALGPPDIEYAVVNLTEPGVPVVAGSAIGESFDLHNTGLDPGSDDLHWTAYISTDAALNIGIDPVLDSGSILGGLAGDDAGAGGPDETNITISANWPAAPGDYHLIVRETAGDEITADEWVSTGVIQVRAPDYQPLNLTNTNNPALSGSEINETFTIRNVGIVDGSATVYWTAYTSSNITLDGGDTAIDSGNFSGGLTADDLVPGAGTDETVITIDNGNWPITTGAYYLIVDIAAVDETNTANNDMNAAFTLNAPDIDYVVWDITNNNSTANINTDINEELVIFNNGLDDGSSIVSWEVYHSTDPVLDGGDTLVDFGTTPGLAGQTLVGPIMINGTGPTGWPGAPGTYYLIGTVSAADETGALPNDLASGAFNIVSPPGGVDYIVTAVSSDTTTVLTGSLINETFDLMNIGGTPGAVDVDWTAWASVDTLLGGDIELGSGTTPLLGASGSRADIPLIGLWPGTAGPYYLFIEVNDPADVDNGNDYAYSGPFTVNDAPDYRVDIGGSPPVLPVISSGLGANTGEALHLAAGTAPGTHNFTIENIDGPGTQIVSWKVYASDDVILDGGDTLLDTGLVPPGAIGTVSFDDTQVFPATYGYYRLLIEVTAPDDSNSTNDLFVSPPVPVWQMSGSLETDQSHDDVLLNDAEDFAILLNPGDMVRIIGTIDDYNAHPNGFNDLFLINTGAATTAIDILMTWGAPPNGVPINEDVADLFIYDDTGTEIDRSDDVYNVSEPDPSPPPSIFPLAVPSGSLIYVQPYFFLGLNPGSTSPGQLYYLDITAF